MKVLTAAILAAGLVIVSAPCAHACTCTIRKHRKDFRNAKTVFIGRVTDIKSDVQIPNELKQEVFYQVTFAVEKRWKGSKGLLISALSNNGLGGCGGFKFQTGERYLVYAETAAGSLVVFSSCARSAPLNRESETTARNKRDLDSGWFRFLARMLPF